MGNEVPKAPNPWRWGGSRFIRCCLLFFLDMPCHLSVCPSLALLPPGGFEFEGAEGSSLYARGHLERVWLYRVM